MKRYIKIDTSNYIIDIFSDNHKDKFDGSEIEFDDVIEFDVWINNKCIFDEIPLPVFKWDSKNKKAVHDPNLTKQLEYRKIDLIEKCKRKVNKKILDKWDEYYQANATEDGLHNTYAICVEKGITLDDFIRLVGIWCNSCDLVDVALNKNTFMCNDIILSLGLLENKHIIYLRKIIESECIYRLKRRLREWSNKKEIAINNCIDLESLRLISFDDIPNV